MKRQPHLLWECLLLALLVCVGALVRIWLQDLPNFAPVAALALFGGYFFRSWLAALCLPLGVLAISDLSIGGYDWRMMALVYAMLAAPVACRPLLRQCLELSRGAPRSAALVSAGLIGCSLGVSLLFFLTTNFGVWALFPMYPRTWAGLLECYGMAIPFFRYTVYGDLFFAVVLFGGHAIAAQFRAVAGACGAPATD